jgi:hypothetical protein
MGEPGAWKFEVSTISQFESTRLFTMSTPRIATMMESRTIALSSTACNTLDQLRGLPLYQMDLHVSRNFGLDECVMLRSSVE